jgi:hypothetical protein
MVSAFSAAQGAPVVFASAGDAPANITGSVTSFRAALGSLNPNVLGSLGSGRREINWDGVPDAFSAPNALPATFFNVNSPRGVVFSTPGTGFQVSANAGISAVEFGNINPTYPTLFETFSPQRLFTAVGSNIMDVTFFVPGSTTPATVSAFGAVFSDVDLPSVTSLQFFGMGNNSLGTFFAPSAAGNETLSFVGVLFNAGEQVGRVRITSGNTIPGANESAAADVVVMDDFIYAEPISTVAAIPEPETYALMLAGLGAVALFSRRRKQKGGALTRQATPEPVGCR